VDPWDDQVSWTSERGAGGCDGGGGGGGGGVKVPDAKGMLSVRPLPVAVGAAAFAKSEATTLGEKNTPSLWDAVETVAAPQTRRTTFTI
jgi:hypothetical protein